MATPVLMALIRRTLPCNVPVVMVRRGVASMFTEHLMTLFGERV